MVGVVLGGTVGDGATGVALGSTVGVALAVVAGVVVCAGPVGVSTETVEAGAGRTVGGVTLTPLLQPV